MFVCDISFGSSALRQEQNTACVSVEMDASHNAQAAFKLPLHGLVAHAEECALQAVHQTQRQLRHLEEEAAAAALESEAGRERIQQLEAKLAAAETEVASSAASEQQQVQAVSRLQAELDLAQQAMQQGALDVANIRTPPQSPRIFWRSCISPIQHMQQLESLSSGAQEQQGLVGIADRSPVTEQLHAEMLARVEACALQAMRVTESQISRSYDDAASIARRLVAEAASREPPRSPKRDQLFSNLQEELVNGKIALVSATDQVNSLKRAVCELEGELTCSRSKNSKLESVMLALEASLEDAEMQLGHCTLQLEESKQEHMRAVRAVTQVSIELDASRNAQAAFKLPLHDLVAHAEECALQAVQVAQSQLRHLEEEAAAAALESEAGRERIQQLEAKLAAAETEVASSAASEQQQVEAVSRLQAELEAAGHELEECKSTAAEGLRDGASQGVGLVLAAMEQTSVVLQEQEGVRQQLETTNTKLTAELEASSVHNSELKATLGELQPFLVAARAELQVQSDQGAKYNSKVAELETQLQTAQARNVDLETALCTVRGQLEEAKHEVAAEEGVMAQLEQVQAELSANKQLLQE